MQEEKWTNLDFSSRTDVLASQLGCDVGGLPELLGFSRASLFAYRSGKARITAKAWAKLEAAERRAEASEASKKLLSVHASEAEKAGGTEEERQARFEEADAPRAKLVAEIVRLREERRGIPVLGWAHAGDPVDYEEEPEGWQRRIPTECRDPKAFAVELEGDSMVSSDGKISFQHGDVLVIQPSEEPYSGCFVTARFKTDGVVFRRMELRGETIVFVPLNERYPVTEHHADEFSWIYPVFGRWTQLWKR